MFSCGTEDKCYCSMTEGGESHTSCCDSDSCISSSKCYCHGRGGDGRKEGHSHHSRSHRSSHSDNNNNNHYHSGNDSKSITQNHQSKKSCKKDKDQKKKSKDGKSRRDNLGLDYELFTVSGSKTTKSSGTTTGKSVKAHEALSVKKSVEAAAIFADVKLSQTTDISTLVSSGGESTEKRKNKMNNLNGDIKRGVQGSQNSEYGITKSDMSSVTAAREKGMMKIRLGGKPESVYGSTNGRPVSASGLEDSLGYLP